MRILGVDPGTLVVGYGCLDLQVADPGRSDPGRSDPGRSDPGGADPDPRGRGRGRPIAHRVANLQRAGRGRVTVVDAGLLRLGRRQDPIASRLRWLAEEMTRLIDEHAPDEVALEEAYFGKSVQSALRIGESRGVILAEAARAGLSVSQFPPARIKRSVTGNGAASKEQVARMVEAVLRLAAPPESTDVTDALAVGLACVEARRRNGFPGVGG